MDDAIYKSPLITLEAISREFFEAQKCIGPYRFATLFEGREDKEIKAPLSAEEEKLASSLFEEIHAQEEALPHTRSLTIQTKSLMKEDEFIKKFKEELSGKKWIASPSFKPYYHECTGFLSKLLSRGLLRLAGEMILDDNALIQIYVYLNVDGDQLYIRMDTKMLIVMLSYVQNWLITSHYPSFSKVLTDLLNVINKIHPLTDPYADLNHLDPSKKHFYGEKPTLFDIVSEARCEPIMNWLFKEGFAKLSENSYKILFKPDHFAPPSIHEKLFSYYNFFLKHFQAAQVI